MRRAWWVWVWFAAGAAALVAAMAWVTVDMRTIARRADDFRHQAQVDAAARTALWRMDSTLAAFISLDENVPLPDDAHPPLGQVPQVRFERREDGSWMIHAPMGLGTAESWVKRLQTIAPEEKRGYGPGQAQQALELQGDFQARQVFNAANSFAPRGSLGPPRVRLLGDDALAVVRSGLGCAVSGRVVRLDQLQKALAALVVDLLPGAKVVPAPADLADSPYPLVTMPLQLQPGSSVSDKVAGPWRRDTLGPALAIAWACVVVVILAMAALLAGAMALAERRAAFVSAVTHELRTPITSLRLYADMLGEGMVADEAKRGEYLATIRGEAERLGRLVENVLAYARLERSAAAAALRTLPIVELVASCRERLERRAREAGMALAVELGAAGEASVRVEPALVEQVLFNLIDNACKYAAGDRRIELRGERRDGRVALLVSDHGPGIAADMRSRLFRPFSRSAREAAGSAPGVGLGLALSRRLARRLGGDLAFVPTAEGACFAVTLPPA